MRTVLFAVVYILSTGLSFPLRAEVPDTVNLALIEVKADYLFRGEMEQRISQTIIEGFKGNDLGTLLATGSHLYIKSDGPGGLATASFRGTSANHTLVLWNDIPLNGPSLGSVDFSTIPVFFTDQIGISWGSKAAGFQTGGLGGVVSILNQPMFRSGLSLQAAQQAGSFGSWGSFLNFGYGTKKVHLRSRIFRKSSRNNFEYFNNAVIPSESMRQKNADFNDYGFLQEVHLIVRKNGVLSLMSWNQWNNRNLPPIMTNLAKGGDPKEFRNDKFHRNIISYNHYWKKLKIDSRIAWLSEDQYYFLRTIGGAGNNETVTLIDSRNKSETYRSSFQADYDYSNHWIFSAKYITEIEIVETTNYAGRSSRLRNSVQFVTNFIPASWLHSSLMLRQELPERGSPVLLPVFETKIVPSTAVPLSITIGLSKNLRYPTLNDLHWFPGGNPELKPELSRAADVSLRWNPVSGPVRHQALFNVYYADISDWIQWRPTSYRYWEPVNIARVKARGAEISYQAETTSGSYSVFGGLTYAFTLTTDESPVAKIEHTAGRQLIYIPKHHGSLITKVERNGVFVSYTLLFVGERSASMGHDVMFRNQLNSYFLHHLAVGYDMVNNRSIWSFEIQVHNVLDKDYQSVLWRPMPGRHFSFGIQYKFNER